MSRRNNRRTSRKLCASCRQKTSSQYPRLAQKAADAVERRVDVPWNDYHTEATGWEQVELMGRLEDVVIEFIPNGFDGYLDYLGETNNRDAFHTEIDYGGVNDLGVILRSATKWALLADVRGVLNSRNFFNKS